jgi:Ca2+-binding RTX toxin-like protein
MAMTVYDTGGTDTLDFSQTSADQVITLSEESLSSVLGGRHNLGIARGATVENAIGGSGNDTLIGNSAANTLNGGADADRLIGGLGNDIYITDGRDTITEAQNAGTDRVQSSATHTLGAHLENLTLTGSGAINGTGNTLNNVITGNGGNNILNGGAGADRLIGGLGNDMLRGDAGTDSLTGGSGRDSFIFRSVSESTTSATTADVITDFVRGTDKINLSAIDAFAGTLANDTFIWKGAAGFNSTTKGEVRYEKFNNSGTANDYTMVLIDNDRDSGVEMAFRLTGLHNLSQSDFVL